MDGSKGVKNEKGGRTKIVCRLFLEEAVLMVGHDRGLRILTPEKMKKRAIEGRLSVKLLCRLVTKSGSRLLGGGDVLSVPMEQDRLFRGVYEASCFFTIPAKAALIYCFEVDGHRISDPRAKRIYGRVPFGKRGRDVYWAYYDMQSEEMPVVGGEDEFDIFWGKDRPLHIPDYETVSCRVHVRGYTKMGKSPYRGTFRGLEERLPYFCRMGINRIVLLPVYEFFDTDGVKCNYWGYGDGFPFAVKQSYSYHADEKKEFQRLVLSCHERGVEVVLMMPFYEGISADMVRECLIYYSRHFHVDGFMINPYIADINKLRTDPYLSDRKIMYEDRTFAGTARCMLKGDIRGAEALKRLMNSGRDSLCQWICAHNTMTLRDLVTYEHKRNEKNGEKNMDGSSDPDGWNCGVEGETDVKSVRKRRREQMRNALMLLMLFSETPCLNGGDEWGNSQGGNNNAYCQDNPTGWTDKNKMGDYGHLVHYVRRVSVFRRKRAKDYFSFAGRQDCCGKKSAGGYPLLSFHGPMPWQAPEPSDDYAGVLLASSVASSLLYIACNMHWEKKEFYLPRADEGYVWRELLFERKNYAAREMTDTRKALHLRGRHIRLFEMQPVHLMKAEPIERR